MIVIYILIFLLSISPYSSFKTNIIWNKKLFCTNYQNINLKTLDNTNLYCKSRSDSFILPDELIDQNIWKKL